MINYLQQKLQRRKWLDKITEKWPIKVLSVAAALVLMIFYRMNTLETRFFSAPLNVQGNERLLPSNTYAQNIRVSLRGEANNIYPILEEDIEVFIDLSRYTNEGVYRAPVQIRRTGSARGVEALEISVDPIEIPIRLEEKVSKHIPVVPVFGGTIAEGYELTSQSIIPTSVIAEGPRSSLESIHLFNTGTIDLEGRFDDFSVFVNILNNDPLIIIYGTRMVEYRGTINRRPHEVQRPEVNINTNANMATSVEEDTDDDVLEDNPAEPDQGEGL